MSKRSERSLPVTVYLLNWVVQEIDILRFKKQCLSLLEELDREGILITKHGRPVARLIPISSDCADLIGSMKDQIKIRGNISSAGVKWRSKI